MGDKPSTSQHVNEEVADPPLSFWRRTARRLTPVEVISRDHLLRRPLRNEQGQPPTDTDPEGPTPPKRERIQPVQPKKKEEEKAKLKDVEEDKEEEEEKETEKDEEQDEGEKEEPYECPLCLEAVRLRNPVTTKCGHIFCQECLEDALRKVRKCPMCQAKVKQHPYIRIYL